MSLKLRRGTNAERLTITPLLGEPIYATDTELLYIGDGVTVGGLLVSGSGVVDHSGLNLDDGTNPHGTTKSDVGLSNVVNSDTTTTANITDSTNKRFVTDANLTVIGNTSGTNTGDETTVTIQTKRPLKTIEGQSLEGSGNIDLTKSDVGLSNVDNTSDVNKPISTATQTALDLKVDENAPITGATKTKITYDAKGLVTSGADATTADIADSTNKRYVTDAQLVVIGNTSNTNSGDQTSIVGITGTKAQFDTACTDGNFLYVGDVVSALKTKSGVVLAVAFTGNPKKATVTFSTAFASANYSVSLICQTTGNTSFVVSAESITASTFVINLGSNNSTNLVDVRWIAVLHGEN